MITLDHCDFATRFLLLCLQEGLIATEQHEELMQSVRSHERRLTRNTVGRLHAGRAMRLRQRLRAQEEASSG